MIEINLDLPPSPPQANDPLENKRRTFMRRLLSICIFEGKVSNYTNDPKWYTTPVSNQLTAYVSIPLLDFHILTFHSNLA